MAGFSCLTLLSCASKWEAAWKEGPAEMLRHPEIFYAGRDILAELESADMSHVCSDCREMSVLNVKDTGCLVMEESFIEEILEELRSWLMD